MPDPAEFNLILLILATAPLFVGLVFLRNRQRRIGGTPHCRRCDYILRGNPSGACPECGAPVDPPRGVVYGDLIRSTPMTLAGWALVALSVLLIALTVSRPLRDYDYYRLRPTGYVVDDATSTNPRTATRAWTELQRRGLDARLPARHHQRLIQFALDQQAAAQPTTPILQPLMDYLGDCQVAGLLTSPQAEKLFANGLRAEIRLRPVVAAGDRYPVQIGDDCRGPRGGCWTCVTEVEIRVGDTVEERWSSPEGTRITPGFGLNAGTHIFAGRAPGKYPIVVTQTARIYRGPLDDVPRSTLVHEATITRTATLNVVAQLPPEAAIKRIKNDALTSAMTGAIKVKDCLFMEEGYHSRTTIRLVLQIAAPPENLAANVSIRLAGTLVPIGTVHLAKGQSTEWSFLSDSLPIPSDVSTVDVIVRSSDEVARETTDLFQMWDGEIQTTNVSVRRKRTR